MPDDTTRQSLQADKSGTTRAASPLRQVTTAEDKQEKHAADQEDTNMVDEGEVEEGEEVPDKMDTT